jgi:hypothetical protein
MKTDDLTVAPAHQLASMIMDGDVASEEMLEAHLDQIATLNDDLKAVATLNEEEARSRAAEADAALVRDEIWGPLHGVPVTIKDAFETKGLRTTSSYPPLSDYVPRQDAVVVARLRDAGAIILGKTNMSTLAADLQSDSRIFGRVNNPWDLERTPGEAAVAVVQPSPRPWQKFWAGIESPHISTEEERLLCPCKKTGPIFTWVAQSLSPIPIQRTRSCAGDMNPPGMFMTVQRRACGWSHAMRM